MSTEREPDPPPPSAHEPAASAEVPGAPLTSSAAPQATETPAETDDSGESLRDRVERALNRLEYRYFPQRWGRRALNENADYHAEHDAESFTHAQIPSGEEVGVRCVWIMEVSLASHVAPLIEGLRRLRLARSDPGSVNPIERIEHARARAGGYGHVAYPKLVPKGTKRSPSFITSAPSSQPVLRRSGSKHLLPFHQRRCLLHSFGSPRRPREA